MRIMLDHPGEAPRDISDHEVGRTIQTMVNQLRAIGEDDAEIADAIEDLCEGPEHPLCLDRVAISPVYEDQVPEEEIWLHHVSPAKPKGHMYQWQGDDLPF